MDTVLPVGSGAAANGALFEQWTGQIPVEHDPEHVADISTETNLSPAGSGMGGPANITIQWKTVPSDVQWFPLALNGVIVSKINISTAKNTTAISYHVDVSPDAGNIRGIESVVEYTIPSSRRMALVIPSREK